MRWPVLKINRFCKTGSGGTPSTRKKDIYYGGNIPWVKSGELKDDVLLSTEETLTEIGLAESAAKWIPAGSVLIAMYGATIGKTALLGVDATSNQAICNIIPNPQIADSRYIWYAIRHSVPQIVAKRVGGAQPNISQKIISQLSLPIPALSEQHRIVEILDQADALRKKRAEADAKAARILPALFYKMFGDPATNPKGLVKKRLGDLIKVRSGNFLPAKNMDSSGHCPVYGGNGINGYHSEYMFEEPVIVLGRVGIYCGVVHYSEPNCWVTDNALYVAEQSKDLHPRYLAEALRIANLNQYAGRAGQPLISGNRIYPIEILVPPPEEQEKFAGMILELSKYESRRESSGVHLETLFSVLMHRAFTGDLTAKWRGAHMKELLQEMEQQAKALEIDDGRLSIEKELKSSIIDHQSEIIHD